MKDKIWSRNFIVISLINFLSILMFYLLIVTIASYAIETYNVSTSIAGLVSSIYVIGALVGRLFTGRFIGKLGPSKILTMGVVLFFISACLYFIEINIGFLLFNRFIQGIFVGIIGTAAGTIIASILPASRKGEGIGYYSLSVILATAIGPFIGIFLMKFQNGNTYIFGLNVLLSAIMILALVFMKLDSSMFRTGEHKETNESFIAKFMEPKSIPISFIALLIGFAYSGVMSFLSFFAEEIHLVDAASFFFIVYAVATILTRPFTGRLMDRKGPNIIVYPCIVLFAVGMYMFSDASSSWMLLVAAALIGLGFGNFNSIAQTIAVKVTEPHRFGFATSTYFIFYDIGLGLGPYLLGLFIPFVGYRAIFLWMLPVILVCIPLYYVLHGRKAKLYI
ncbi:MFS transporter [Metabacillus halosaccharovorans]|uniref:MFS transporter n=1 Tax=Metabacillus halosaccharovorans TaxID=930124 RepID=UPI001C1F552B|nr:MFS transporter [Metabacillus halosaccharovorans]MBU7595262.1 MFS transporter [Metabacillus halosaccharovorans]